MEGGTSSQTHPTFAGVSHQDVLKRIDDAHRKLDKTLKAIKLAGRGAAARNELLDCIATTVVVARKVNEETSGPDITRLTSDLAAQLEQASVDKFTHRVDPFSSRVAKQLGQHQAKIQLLFHQLTLCLLSHQPTPSPSTLPSLGPNTETTGSDNQENVPKASGQSYQSPKWIRLLGPTKKVLNGVSQASSAIPVVGQYVQLGVGAANALIDMITGMDDNDTNGQSLCDSVDRFTRIVDTFNKTFCEHVSSGELETHFGSFREQCDSIKRKIGEIRTQFPGRKILTSSENASTISELKEILDAAWKELDLSVNLDTNSKVTAQERAYYFGFLGDADYGHIGHLKDDGCCLEGTREEMLETIDTWADDPTSPSVMLLRGQAGRGKSSVARSSLQRFRARRKDETSSAIFHFRYDKTTLENRSILALVRQLAKHEESPLGRSILRSIKENKGVGSCLEDHFKILLDAFRKLDSPPPGMLFVIDALDECKDQTLVSTLLRLIADHSSSSSSPLPLGVKFLFTSRPEAHILREFQSFKPDEKKEEDLDMVKSQLIHRDLSTYFTERLNHIFRKPNGKIGEELEPVELWQTDGTVPRLVELSEDLFQWANAAMNYVKKAPDVNLKKLVGPSGVKCGLPDLYRRILAEAFPRDTGVMDPEFDRLIQHVLGSLVASSQTMTPSVLGYLWSEMTGVHAFRSAMSEVRSIIDPLRSMLVIPVDDSSDSPVRFMHTSVRDFLTSPDQCRDSHFLIDETAHHARLAAICFDRMKRDLKLDICEINDPSKTNSEILDVEKQRISSGLLHCCRAWAHHLSEVKHGSKIGCSCLHIQLDEFCGKQLLYWLEVLSLRDALPEVYEIVRRGNEWIAQGNGVQCQADALTTLLLTDVNDFCRLFFHLISSHAQHIPLSYLLHFPMESTLRQSYEPLMGHRLPRIIRGPQSGWTRVISTGSSVRCVALSPDGKTLAFGSTDGTIRLWDIESGLQEGKPLVGHNDWVFSIAFSPDGMMLASGSKDKAICLWNVKTGLRKGEILVNHAGEVCSVAFSPDGKTLASGSADTTIRLWEIESGLQKGKPLIGHGDWVRSVAFSQDGKILASGSDDKTGRMWDVESGLQKGKSLVGHKGWVRSISFSPDGAMLASGSNDETVRLWDTKTGLQTGKPLVGHHEPVHSIAFSKDGRMLASGSDDATIRLWDVQSQLPKGKPLVSHGATIWSVVFSTDGKMLISGSGDETICLWDVERELQPGKSLSGHDGSVLSVAFHSEAKILASGSTDKTVRLWDVETGLQKGEQLTGHEDEVNTVAFSPDGSKLASGSDDGAVCLWDVKTGLQKGKPLVGHSEGVWSIAFSMDSKLLASGSGDGMVHLWDVESGNQIGTPLVGHTTTVRSLAFSWDTKMLASGSDDTNVCLWDVETRFQKGEPLMGHDGDVNSVAFSSDGKLLASGSDDKTILLWDVETRLEKGKPLVGHDDLVLKVTFSSDGKTLTSDYYHEQISWNIGASELLATALCNGSNQSETSTASIGVDQELQSKSYVKEFYLSTRPSERGWVYLRGKRCVWVPDQFYTDPDGMLNRESVFGNLIVFWHPDIHILDISALC